ncbi:hypothetical protein [Stenotrophomonas tumulicola]|uniref:Uncharacterized protein n=1 Tax=Stenotrophomonas tumulicola TaxID=1685415 RepID=A0A7W3FJ73_9GAMM|nr:hypothetical protein [Stenotrophomonas tumulicola]MBA8680504.1 hypothetical protein [Stenotrophomonas tumulicola]
MPTAESFTDALAAEQAADAEREAQAQALAREEADVTNWHKRIKESRDFDKGARKGYALDRRYCANRVDPVYDVSVPIAGTYVNLLTSFLYARDPEPAVQPAESVGTSRVKLAKQVGRTLEIVIARLWKRGRLKHAADAMVRSGLSVGIGWIKAAWHRETERDAMTDQRIADLRNKMQALASIETELAAGDAANPDLLRAQYEQQMQALESQVEQIIYNSLVVDFVRADDVQVSMDVATLKDYVIAPWIAHRSFMPYDEAVAAFPELRDELGKAEAYYHAKRDCDPRDGGFTATYGAVSDTDAEVFRSATVAGQGADAGPRFLCVWEVWDLTTNLIHTITPGLRRYLRAPYAPDQASTRFYPFFQWAPLWVDGERHPQSLVDRSRALLDEYNRTRTNYREHRRRAIPKMGFDRGALDPDDARKLEGATTSEMVGLDLKGQTSRDVLFAVQYNQIDAALYDTAPIRAELELIWGIQEALSSSIQTAKTATESEIQQQGTESRLGYSRDSLDELLGELALYSGELAMSPNGLSVDEVFDIAGPEALWFNAPLPDLVNSLLNVDIRAGSSGRPASSLRRQQWGAILPQLQEAVITIGRMRGATSFDIANSLEQLAVESVERLGDPSIDAYAFIPQVPEVSAMGMPGADPMMPGAPSPDPMQQLPPAEAPVPTAAPVGGVVAQPL